MGFIREYRSCICKEGGGGGGRGGFGREDKGDENSSAFLSKKGGADRGAKNYRDSWPVVYPIIAHLDYIANE